MARAVGVAGVRGISGGEDCDAGGMVGRDSSEGGAEVWMAFKVAK